MQSAAKRPGVWKTAAAEAAETRNLLKNPA
jgi:hypothetical protein